MTPVQGTTPVDPWGDLRQLGYQLAGFVLMGAQEAGCLWDLQYTEIPRIVSS